MDVWFHRKVLCGASPSRPAPSRPAASALVWRKPGREGNELSTASRESRGLENTGRGGDHVSKFTCPHLTRCVPGPTLFPATGRPTQPGSARSFPRVRMGVGPGAGSPPHRPAPVQSDFIYWIRRGFQPPHPSLGPPLGFGPCPETPPSDLDPPIKRRPAQEKALTPPPAQRGGPHLSRFHPRRPWPREHPPHHGPGPAVPEE